MQVLPLIQVMQSKRKERVRGVLFDFDGTLTAPGELDFVRIRQEIGCPPSIPVLEYINTLPPKLREQASATLESYEEEAARRSTPNEGALEILTYLGHERIPYALATRNSRKSLLCALENFREITASSFRSILSRDDPIPPKPDPAPVLQTARTMGISVDELLVVGDYVFDVEAGRQAGALTVLLTNGAAAPPECGADFVIDSLLQLPDLIAERSPLPEGKLPNQFLGRVLESLQSNAAGLLIPPGVGQDVSAVQLPGQESVLVLKTDPITFSADEMAYHSVVVNMNDLATSGAIPRWLVATLLFPPGFSAAEIMGYIRDLDSACHDFGIQLCGGHTELTTAVRRPVVVGTIVGTASQVLDKSRVSEGDFVLLTKPLAVEGTAILARDFPGPFALKGMSEDELQRCQRLLFDPGISVLAEARLATSLPGVTSLHDVTEGGISTALEELSIGTGHRIDIEMSQIPILPETQRICSLAGINPFGLIASGSLLITVRPEQIAHLLESFEINRLSVHVIGTVGSVGKGVTPRDESGPWPSFARDEIARAIETLSNAFPRSGNETI